MKSIEEQNTEVINTKVSPNVMKQLRNICAKLGITFYKLMHMMIDCIIRYMSDWTNRTPEIERAMSIMDHMQGWKDAVNFSEHGSDMSLYAWVGFFGRKDCKGLRGVMCEDTGFFGEWRQTVNVQHIFEAVLNWLYPERYKKMRILAARYGLTSQLDLLDRMLDKELEGTDTDGIREEFEDCARTDYGQKATDHKYKRKLRRDMERIRFNEEDVPELPELFSDDLRRSAGNGGSAGNSGEDGTL